MGQVTEVVLEGCEAGDDLAIQSEGRRAIGDALLCLGNNLENSSPQ